VTRDELVKAVIADPDADAPRQAFADWGVAHRDLQGELTRLQLADRDHRRKYGRSGADRRAANALVETHGATWAREVGAFGREPRFARGFVEGITLDAPTFLARAPELYAVAPIRAVTFLDAANHVAVLAASSNLARLVALELRNKSGASPLGDDGLRTLLASPHLRNLTMLVLAKNDIHRDGIEAICAARLPKLAYVGLFGNPEDSPVEEFSEDPQSGIVITNSVGDTPLGKELEAKYGEQRWLHAPSLLRVYPPDEQDF
jgi:uncharacterized protein (TIGR02996 family)